MPCHCCAYGFQSHKAACCKVRVQFFSAWVWLHGISTWSGSSLKHTGHSATSDITTSTSRQTTFTEKAGVGVAIVDLSNFFSSLSLNTPIPIPIPIPVDPNLTQQALSALSSCSISTACSSVGPSTAHGMRLLLLLPALALASPTCEYRSQ